MFEIFDTSNGVVYADNLREDEISEALECLEHLYKGILFDYDKTETSND
jgi:hypothetical protein